ncbi:MAG: hypothetical protein LBV63_00520, partial [Candidatus Methanoplasma sp.]|nr:hypothetical protein [Candidatus Methanoplasma sp.]
AECGGLMYLCSKLKDFEGKTFDMTGVFDAETVMNGKRTLGYIEASSSKDSVLSEKGWTTRGHEFHFSTAIPSGNEEYAWELSKGKGICNGSDGFVANNTLANYLHLHFASNPKMPVRFVYKCCEYTRH